MVERGIMMTNRDTYTFELKPSEEMIQKTYDDYLELKGLLENSILHNGGFYILNKNKIFEEDELPGFCNFEIKLVSNPDQKSSIRRIEVRLSKNYNVEETLTNVILKSPCKSQARNRGKYLNWSEKPDKVYGRQTDKVTNTQYQKGVFNRGHLIADSLIKYSESFNYYKRENFVMITNWCNRANTNVSNKIACGMYYFEKIILDTLETDNATILYRVTPVFKIKEIKCGQSNCKEFEYLPRGIIIEAKIEGDTCFKGENARAVETLFTTEFNVFIPNAQSNIDIRYDMKCN